LNETALGKKIQIALSRAGARVFRNNVGTAWTGKKRTRIKNDVIIQDARIIKYGLFPGSGDYIGFIPKTITPDMVGQRVALFVSCEIKTKTGPIQKNQEKWMNFIQENGGIAFVARSPDEAIEGVKNA